MPHRRDEIRKLIVEAMRDKTIVKNNVFNWRMRPVQNEHDIPCINVLIPEEMALEESGAGDLIYRQCDVYLIIYSAVSHHDDIVCDVIAKQIETILNNLSNGEFNFKYKKMEIGTENLSTKVLVSCALIYECIYATPESKQIDGQGFNSLSIEVKNG